MEPTFWRECWREGKTGFHRTAPNPRLIQHLEAITAPTVKRVLVPLCGKSLDLWYLASRGLEVVGVELVEEAARAFFAEHDLTPEVASEGPFLRLAAGGVTLFVGDFFAATPALLGGAFDAAYDRAALIALPPALRGRYVERVRALLGPGAHVLLLTLEFDADGGPPHSVPQAEVEALYTGASTQALGTVDVAAEVPQVFARGATAVAEHSLLITLP